MSQTIFRHEFKMHLRSVLGWSAAIGALMLVYVAMFSSLAEDAALLQEMMANFPEALLKAFGMDGVDLSTILGFFGFAFLFAQVCLAIQAAGYGFGLVSIEEREWTADFLLAKPVGRAQILTSKLLAVLCGLAITNAVVWATSFAYIELFRGGKSYEVWPLAALLLSIAVFQLFFLGVGLAISVLVKRIRNVTPWSMGLGFGMYVISAFGGLLGENVLEMITPFKHFEPQRILQSGRWDPGLALISAVVIVVSLAASYALYTRRDIPSAV